MECPYCGAELVWNDYYGKMQYAEHSWIEKTGDIYKCPNNEGFEDLDEAQKHKDKHPELSNINLEDICCNSSMYNGYFYTDSNDNLLEGYPC